jgi:hypothetical protein
MASGVLYGHCVAQKALAGARSGSTEPQAPPTLRFHSNSVKVILEIARPATLSVHTSGTRAQRCWAATQRTSLGGLPEIHPQRCAPTQMMETILARQQGWLIRRSKTTYIFIFINIVLYTTLFDSENKHLKSVTRQTKKTTIFQRSATRFLAVRTPEKLAYVEVG